FLVPWPAAPLGVGVRLEERGYFAFLSLFHARLSCIAASVSRCLPAFAGFTAYAFGGVLSTLSALRRLLSAFKTPAEQGFLYLWPS
ncbi:hypothetical protein, partial [Deinococcus sp. 6YEL10]|uniref:hypothetical protein n=1 Tax=Deinococcus sp. 6YEL10 TaxID=2745870 RepID=UPI001E43AE1A